MVTLIQLLVALIVLNNYKKKRYLYLKLRLSFFTSMHSYICFKSYTFLMIWLLWYIWCRLQRPHAKVALCPALVHCNYKTNWCLFKNSQAAKTPKRCETQGGNLYAMVHYNNKSYDYSGNFGAEDSETSKTHKFTLSKFLLQTYHHSHFFLSHHQIGFRPAFLEKGSAILVVAKSFIGLFSG